MTGLIEFFELENAVPILLIFGLLRFVGAQMDDRDSTVRWWTRGAAAAGFLLYAVLGIAHYGPSDAWDFAGLVLRAILAMCTANGLAAVLVPVTCFFHLHLWAEPRRKERALAAEKARMEAHEALRRVEDEMERAKREILHEAERRRRQEIANRPPPPTREERMAAAKTKHERAVALLESAGLDEIELKAGKEHAKQQMLREIDEAMQ